MTPETRVPVRSQTTKRRTPRPFVLGCCPRCPRTCSRLYSNFLSVEAPTGASSKSPRRGEGLIPIIAEKLLFGGFGLCRIGFGGIAFRIFAAEALDATGGVHELLLAGEEGMAGGTDFHGNIALMGRAGYKCVAAGAMHEDFSVVGMNGCFHGCS